MTHDEQNPWCMQALKLAQPDIDLLVMEQQLQDYEDTQMLVGSPAFDLKDFPSEQFTLRSSTTARTLGLRS